jgi:hypothetical protein
VVNGLVVGQLIGVPEKAVPGFRKRYDAQGLFLRDFHGLVGNERLLGEPPNVFVASFAISAVGKLREVCYRNYAKPADFLERVHLGIAEKVAAITDVIRARKVAAFVAGGMLFANLGAIAAARDFRHGLVGIPGDGRTRPMLADRAAYGRVTRVARVLRIVGKDVA